MGKRRRRRDPVGVDGYDVPPELLDADAPVWHDQQAFHAYMAGRGWSMPGAERMGATTAPSNRRRAAAAGWAADNDIIRTGGGHADLHRLRAMGLIR